MTIDDVYTVIISLILVFSVLAGICAFVYVVSVLIRSLSRKTAAPAVKEVATEQKEIVLSDANCVQNDDSAIVAAIIAAITAYRQAKFGSAARGFRVVSFKRTGTRR